MLIYLLLKIKWLCQKKWKEEKEYLRLINTTCTIKCLILFTFWSLYCEIPSEEGGGFSVLLLLNEIVNTHCYVYLIRK